MEEGHDMGREEVQLAERAQQGETAGVHGPQPPSIVPYAPGSLEEGSDMSHLDVRQTINTVVTYLRVSTEAQVEKFSLLAQDKFTREVAAKYGWEIAKVYRDEGFSGSLIEKRPAFFALLQDATKPRFDAVVVTDFDRLTRSDNLRDLGRIQEVFIQHDIKIVTLSDGIDLSNDDQWFLSS